MIAARSVNEPDPRQQRITMALLPVPAALSITAAALLAPHKVAADVGFVVVVFAAVYIRRFGARGRALGMVAFMAYFFTLYLRASISELPWMIGAVVVGTVCTFVMSAYVLPDRPERVLRATIRALRARMAIVVDTTAEAVRTGRLDERRRRRMRARTIRLNETALMVQSQIEDKADPAMLWPGVTAEQLAPWLFDAELAIEWVATAGRRAAAGRPPTYPPPPASNWSRRSPSSRARSACRRPAGCIGPRARPSGSSTSAGPPPTRPASRRTPPCPGDHQRGHRDRRSPRHRRRRPPAPATPATESAASIRRRDPERRATDEPPDGGLRPTTRQAIQVTVAASLAIVIGELVSPARWFWAVIAAFVIFAGTNSWGETLTKGWQRLLGTMLGVPAACWWPRCSPATRPPRSSRSSYACSARSIS